MEQHSDLLARWPDLTTVAADLAKPYDTVFAWKARNSIPIKHWNALIASAARRGITGISRQTLLAAYDARGHAVPPVRQREDVAD